MLGCRNNWEEAVRISYTCQMKRLEVLTLRSRYPDAATFDGLLRADVLGRMKHLTSTTTASTVLALGVL